MNAASLGSKPFGQIGNRQVIAASLFPAVEPHYAGLVAIVILFVAMAVFLLSKFADSIRRAAGTIPLESGDGFGDEDQPPNQDSSTVSSRGKSANPR